LLKAEERDDDRRDRGGHRMAQKQRPQTAATLNYHGCWIAMPFQKYSGIALSERAIALNRSDILHAAKSFLKALVDYSGETAALLFCAGQSDYRDTEESPTPASRRSDYRHEVPATATSNPGRPVSPEGRLDGSCGRRLPAMMTKSIQS
jgi:hypothetical protein